MYVAHVGNDVASNIKEGSDGRIKPQHKKMTEEASNMGRRLEMFCNMILPNPDEVTLRDVACGFTMTTAEKEWKREPRLYKREYDMDVMTAPYVDVTIAGYRGHFMVTDMWLKKTRHPTSRVPVELRNTDWMMLSVEEWVSISQMVPPRAPPFFLEMGGGLPRGPLCACGGHRCVRWYAFRCGHIISMDCLNIIHLEALCAHVQPRCPGCGTMLQYKDLGDE